MIKAQLPENEIARLNALFQVKILDTGPEKPFDDITQLAASICGTPISLITLIDANRQWFKSKVGLEVTETYRDLSFCAHAILESDIFIVPDALADERFANNPLVISEPKIRFYAGVPLVTSDNYTLGTLNVIDHVPRKLSLQQIEALHTLSRQVVKLIELRRDVARLETTPLQRQHTEKQRRQFFQKIVVGFGLASTILVSVGLVTYRSLTSLVQTGNAQIQNYQVLEELKDIRSNIQQASLAKNRYIISPEARYLDLYYESEGKINSEISQLQQAIANKPIQQRYLATLTPLISKKFADIKATVNLRKTKGIAASQPVLVQQSKQLTDKIEITLSEMEKAENRALTQQSQAAEKKAKETIFVFLSGIILNFLILSFVYYLIQRELTQRQQIKVALEQERDFTFAVVNMIVSLVVVLDSQGKIVRFNRSCEQTTGYFFDEVKGKYFWDLFLVSEELEPVKAIFNNIRAGHFPNHQENYWQTRNGSRRLIAWSNTALCDKTGAVEYVISTGIDITDSRQVQESLIKTTTLQQAILNSANYMIISTNVDGTIMTFNAAAEQTLGYTAAEIIGKTTPLIFHDEAEVVQRAQELSREIGVAINPDFEAFIVRAQRGQSEEREWSYVRKDGSRLSVLVSMTALRDANGIITGFLGIGSDISDRIQAEKALRESEEQYRALFENASDLIQIVGSNGQFIFVNSAWQKTLGYSEVEIVNLSIFDTIHPEQRSHYLKLFQRVISGEDVEKIAATLITKSGEKIEVEGSINCKFTDGKPVSTQCIFHNITEHKQAELAQQEANEQLSIWVNELKQRNREITLLSEMTDVLQACLTVEEAYVAVPSLVQPLFPNASGGLFLMNASKTLVESTATWGSTLLASEKIFTPNDCWALRRGRSHLVEDADNGLLCKHLHHALPAQSLCVPMMAQGEALGVLYLNSFELGQFTEAKQHLATTVAEHIALALANLKLRETLHNQSTRDPLTGLFNRRYMEDSLEREIHRCDRKQQPLSVMMIDIDHFKRFNDSFGHEAGDTVLRELGQFLQRYVRGSDIACRYGGEEFTLILPEASIDVTQKRAEQLCNDIKHLNLENRYYALGSLTLSIGIASFPTHGLSLEAVIRAADAALYIAKKEGRDTVRAAA
ncbi:MAG: PAS domain S-box protein [Gloeocapsa sp. UFS-A4-WI-NPMV-4B04]|nr:PAS domain S-box protein [Gloeocapsa sp. UFS-A4-WI-NPMV-4B04]